MNYRLLFALLPLLCLSLCSCSDDDDDTEKEWRTSTTEYFAKVYADAVAQQSQGNSDWLVIRSLVRNSETTATDDNIVVHKLDSVAGNYRLGSPLQNDTVRVHYEGRNINDEVFDRSWSGTYNLKTMKPSELAVNGVVEGFSTALQYMHPGDRWLVYIPQKLGYADDDTSDEIPAYSTLIFDITLDSFISPGHEF